MTTIEEPSLFDVDAYVIEPVSVEVLSAGQRRTQRQRIAVANGRHPANGLPIDPTHSCGECSSLQRYEWHSRHYLKCPHHALGESHSEASDMRRGWPACPRFTPAQIAEEGPAVHSGDPRTSHKAAERAADPERLSALQLRVLTNLYEARNRGDDGGLTDWEHPGILQTTAGKRRLALQRAGLVEDSGYTDTNPNGSEVIVWMITAAGVRALDTRAAAA